MYVAEMAETDKIHQAEVNLHCRQKRGGFERGGVTLRKFPESSVNTLKLQYCYIKLSP